MKFNHIKYSRGQQIIFVVLACFIVGCFIIDWSIRKFNSPIKNSFIADSTLLSKIALFETNIDSLKGQRQHEFLPRQKLQIPTQELFSFDPNTIDSIDILRLGFKPYMAHNWLQYIRHGGKINSCRKLRSIYGIDTLLVDSLCTLLTIKSIKAVTTDSTTKYKPKEYFQFELNSADTTLLSQLPGIGIGRAKMIVNYRNQIGGFYSAEQLREIEYIPDSIINLLVPYITIELDSIKSIDLNTSSLKRLHRHPYISYEQAKAIYNLRWDKQHKGSIINIEELKTIFNEKEFERIKYYIKTK